MKSSAVHTNVSDDESATPSWALYSVSVVKYQPSILQIQYIGNTYNMQENEDVFLE